jgi:hypothetical protein
MEDTTPWNLRTLRDGDRRRQKAEKRKKIPGFECFVDAINYGCNSDDIVAPLANLRRCFFEVLELTPNKMGCVLYRSYAASDSDCMSRNMKAPSFSRCFKSQAVRPTTESAITILREACFLV